MEQAGIDAGNHPYARTITTTPSPRRRPAPYAGMSFFHSPNYTGEALYDFLGVGAINTGIQYFPAACATWAADPAVPLCNELVARTSSWPVSHELWGDSQTTVFQADLERTRAHYRPGTNVYLAE